MRRTTKQVIRKARSVGADTRLATMAGIISNLHGLGAGLRMLDDAHEKGLTQFRQISMFEDKATR